MSENKEKRSGEGESGRVRSDVAELSAEAAAGAELYEVVAKATNDAIWDWDLTTDRLSWNDGVRKLFGYAPGQVSDSVEWWYENIHAADRERVVGGIHRVIDEGGQEWSDEYRFAKVDGSFAEVSDRGFVIRDGQGRPVRMLGGMTDITGRRREERERQFLLELGEKIRLGGLKPEELLDEVTRATGEHLGAARCLFIEIEEAEDRGVVKHEFRREGLPAVPGEYRISEYSPATLEEIKAGRAVVNHDAEHDPRTASLFKTTYEPYGERSYVSVPLFTEGRWRAIFWVSGDRARHWSPQEVTFLEGVAERAWLAAEKLRNEAGLRESEERLRAIVNSATAGITQTDSSGRFVFANDRYCEIVGYTREELLRMRMQDITDPEILPTNVELYVRAWRDGTPFVIEKQYIRKDGSRVWVNNSVAPVVGAGGTIDSIVCITIDVTQRIEAEENLRQSREMLSLAMSGSRMGAWSRNLLADEVYWSPELEAIFGLAAGSFSGKLADFYEFVHPEDRDLLRREVWKAIEERRDYVIEFRYRHADGSLRWMEGRGQAIYTAEGKPTQVFGIGIDITERKRAALNAEFLAGLGDDFARVSTPEEIVRAAGERLNRYLGISTCGFVEVDETADTATINYEWHREGVPSLVGAYSLPEFVTAEFRQAARSGETIVVRDVETDSRIADPEVWKALSIGAHINVPLIRRGEWRFSLCVYQTEAYDWREDEVDLMRELASRVWTRLERAFAERERERLLEWESSARLRAEEANRLKDEFLATVSHELRTPLTAITGWAHLLETGGLDRETARHAVSVIRRNCEQQRQIVEDVLDVSRFITGKLKLEREVIDLNGVVQAAIETVRPTAEAKKIRLLSELEPGVEISGDPSRLQQVVWNLLTNAVKFTPAGGRVVVSVGRLLTHARVEVSDTGQGIPAEFLPHVFDRFRQADSSTTRHHGGLGLGLSIVRHIVEAHGGSVHAYSGGEGQGATFTIDLPLPVASREEAAVPRGEGGARRARAADTPVDAAAGEDGEAPPPLAGLRVLLVDDEPDTLEMVSFLLRRGGAVVTAVRSAAEALDALRRVGPEVIVADIGMPEMDGYELMRRVRALGAEAGGQTPAIALTAYAAPTDQAQAFRAGFQRHLAKPVQAGALYAAVAVLAGRSASPES